MTPTGACKCAAGRHRHSSLQQGRQAWVAAQMVCSSSQRDHVRPHANPSTPHKSRHVWKLVLMHACMHACACRGSDVVAVPSRPPPRCMAMSRWSSVPASFKDLYYSLPERGLPEVNSAIVAGIVQPPYAVMAYHPWALQVPAACDHDWQGHGGRHQEGCFLLGAKL